MDPVLRGWQGRLGAARLPSILRQSVLYCNPLVGRQWGTHLLPRIILSSPLSNISTTRISLQQFSLISTHSNEERATTRLQEYEYGGPLTISEQAAKVYHQGKKTPRMELKNLTLLKPWRYTPSFPQHHRVHLAALGTISSGGGSRTECNTIPLTLFIIPIQPFPRHTTKQTVT